MPQYSDGRGRWRRTQTDPWRRLGCAVLLRSVKDASGRDPALASEARDWLLDTGREVAQLVGIDGARVTAYVEGLAGDE